MNIFIINTTSLIVFAIFLVMLCVVYILCLPLFIVQGIVLVVSESIGRMKQ